jgi:hypothetical protein
MAALNLAEGRAAHYTQDMTTSIPPVVAAPTLAQRVRRWCWVVGIPLGTSYLLIVGLMMAAEDTLVYQPSPAHHWQAPLSQSTREVELHLVDGTAIHAWWQPDAEAEGTALYFHGNGGNLSGAQFYDGWRGQLRLSVLLVEYPGYGRSGGQPSEAGCYAAANAGYDWLTQVQAVPASAVLIMGESLGGAVAIDLASRRPHRALIVTKTFASLPRVAGELYPWLPTTWIMRNRFDSLSKIGQCAQPIFMVHSTRDELTPFAHAELLFAAAPEPKQFVRVETKRHNDSTTDGVGATLRQFLATHAPLNPP